MVPISVTHPPDGAILIDISQSNYGTTSNWKVGVNLETLLGNTIIYLEIPLISWKYHFELGNLSMKLETSNFDERFPFEIEDMTFYLKAKLLSWKHYLVSNKTRWVRSLQVQKHVSKSK